MPMSAPTATPNRHRRSQSVQSPGKRLEGEASSGPANRRRSRISSRGGNAGERRGQGRRGPGQEPNRGKIRSRKSGTSSKGSSIPSEVKSTSPANRIGNVGAGAVDSSADDDEGEAEGLPATKPPPQVARDTFPGGDVVSTAPRHRKVNSAVDVDSEDEGGIPRSIPRRTHTPVGRKRTSPEGSVDSTAAAGPRPVQRHAFDGAAAAAGAVSAGSGSFGKAPPRSPVSIAARRAASAATRQPASPPSGEALVPPSGSPSELRWPFTALSRESSPLMGLESGLASESELGASEASDWDQVRDWFVCRDGSRFVFVGYVFVRRGRDRNGK